MAVAININNTDLFSVADASLEIGVTGGRIRQILTSPLNADSSLATKIGRDWQMTPAQLEKLRDTQRELFKNKFGKYPNED